jgi:DNA-binding NarL/FixJ family response regulator
MEQSNGIKIVIYEDNEIYRKGIIESINSNSLYQVVGNFSNCDKLLSQLDNYKPNLVLMDISMPRISGIEAVKMIALQFPNLPVLIQTVFEDEDKIFASVRAGASGYILKSAGPEKLLEAIQQVMDGGAAFTPVIAKKILLMVKDQSPAFEAKDFSLSNREQEILRYLVKGLSYKQIAAAAEISTETVHSHIKKIYEKLHVHSMSGAVAKALKYKIT